MSETTYDLVIVGAGPAGLATALEAQRAGIHNFLILEKGSSHSSMIRTYYKEGKRVDAQYAGLEAVCHGILCLKDGNRETYLAFMDSVIKNHHLPIEYSCEVWSISQKIQEAFEITTNLGTFYAKSIVIAIGKMGRPRQPEYIKDVPLSLKRNDSLLFDINKRNLKGQKVLVVGGGDTAGEYADLLHKDSEVILSYRRDKIARMNPMNTKIVEDLIANNKISTLLGSNIQKIEDDNGRPKVHFEEAQFEPLVVDAILYALGGITPVNFLKNCNIKLSESGEVDVNEFKESSIPALYIVGDLLGKAQGGGSIISGFNSAHLAVSHLAKVQFQKDVEAPIVSLDHLNF